MANTRIEISALTSLGRAALKIQYADEVAYRDKYKDVDRWKLPNKVRRYLKTVSLFESLPDPSKHIILGFRRMSRFDKAGFYEGVKKSFYDNGCSLDDFEVKFYDK